MPFRANTLSNVYTPETLEHYYKMRGKKASSGAGSSLKKLAESKKETPNLSRKATSSLISSAKSLRQAFRRKHC